MRNEKGFTLIEIVMVIVLLGILAAVAIPRYIDLQAEAEQGTANGILAAARSATVINFAGMRADAAGLTAITTGADLLGAMDSTPTGCVDAAATVVCTINGTGYTITISSAETTLNAAILTPTSF